MSGEHEIFLNFDRIPAIQPGPDSPRVLIVGVGIVGMSTTWTLLDRGYHVTVVAEHFATRNGKRLTSQIAGALNTPLPSAVIHPTKPPSKAPNAGPWSPTTSSNTSPPTPTSQEDTMVQMRNTMFLLDKLVKDDPLKLHKMREIERGGVNGFRHDPSVIHKVGISEETWKDCVSDSFTAY
ncbi:d-amino acid [Moniliophthora roreri MCA 2997]|uniref:D-amino acid n=1 Tax=Moniliophthora roreri (strain MCA 2997) TaxID=1381753 RepID=V2WYY8_MONRO|nr:d-amino acid [Moniliophthora roreri MCA 2997]